ncbi:MAG: flagellin [Oscillospiraceae bacterium]|jgi:flagellin|nr:flagellin [Oscillospiraceae bacterium]
MRIQNNMMAINTHRQLSINQINQTKSTEKLSSGFRINRAGDDAAGLSISEKMRAQVRGLNRASANAQDGISMIQAAEGALQETHSILQRIRELAVQGANDVNAPDDRVAIMDEIEQLGQELDRIADTTNFNGKYLLSGKYAGNDELPNGDENIYLANHINPNLAGVDAAYGPINLQVGANTLFGDVISVKIVGMNATNLLNFEGLAGDHFWNAPSEYGSLGFITRMDFPTDGPNSTFLNPNVGVDLNNDEARTDAWSINTFQSLINVIDGKQADGQAITSDDAMPKTGIALVNQLRSELGAVQNRLEHTVSNLDTVSENVQAAESRIRDVDMAKEMMAFTKNNILNQAATAMLAQANQSPQTVLQLLQ